VPLLVLATRVRLIGAHALDGDGALEPVGAPDDTQEHLGVPAVVDRALDLVAPGARDIKHRGHRLEEGEGGVEDMGASAWRGRHRSRRGEAADRRSCRVRLCAAGERDRRDAAGRLEPGAAGRAADPPPRKPPRGHETTTT